MVTVTPSSLVTMRCRYAGLTVSHTEETWQAFIVEGRMNSWQTWSRIDPWGVERRWGGGEYHNEVNPWEYLTYLGYLDRGEGDRDRGQLQLAGWNQLGLSELGHRLLILCKHYQSVIIVLVFCSRRARQEECQLQAAPRVCLHWEESQWSWQVVGWGLHLDEVVLRLSL